MKKEITEFFYAKIRWLLGKAGIHEKIAAEMDTLILLLAVIAVTLAVAELLYRILLFATRRMLRHKRYLFLEKLAVGKRMRKVAYIISPIMLNGMLPFITVGDSTGAVYLERGVWIYFVISVVMAVNAMLSAVGDSAFTNRRYHDRPIKGFIQIGKIIVYLIAVIVIISILTGKSPLYLIGGLGAFAAVLMLVAKDSIMGFVGGFLLLENDMVRLGDWIEVPNTAINGCVFDISLTIVKVRNWDNTIATVPPYTLINESFVNWRGMSDSGGRRIARGYTVKLDHIKPCSDSMLRRLKTLDSEFTQYISRKLEQLAAGKVANTGNPDGLADGTIDTNAGLFRAYAYIYLCRHPMIRKDMLIMVRTLEPTDTGLPIQFYCFTSTTDWGSYESIQSEIMEHFALVMPQFELYPFQSAGARDTIISGMLEGNYPIERIDGLPYGTVK